MSEPSESNDSKPNATRKRKHADNGKARRKRVKSESDSVWKGQVVKKLREAKQKLESGEQKHKVCYAWFRFVRNLLKQNDNKITLKMFKKEAIDYFERENIESMTKQEFFSDICAKISKHPKFIINFKENILYWKSQVN